jgi:glucose/arabinose dehydrogenase
MWRVSRFCYREAVVMRPLSVMLLCLPILASTLGCGDDGNPGGDIQEPTQVATVTVSGPATTVMAGQTLQLTATAQDANGTVLQGHTFAWTTSDAEVATVSSSGTVSALSEGQAVIGATTDGVSGSLTISVTAAPPTEPPELQLQQVATGLDFPLYLTSPPGDSRLFVVQRAGAIRVVKDGALLPTPFLDLTSKVLSEGGEQGLLGLAFTPDYASSGRFVVHYIDLSGNTRVSQFLVSADPDRADPSSESLVLAAEQPGVAHKGGQLLFGPDGMLYIGLGDGADNDQGRGQSLSELLGSILRIDVSSAPYTVPPDNPFVSTAGARAEVWSYGLRNPWRFSFDHATGDLYVGDVGESNWEEVDYASAATGASKGVNYGWSLMEGRHCARAEGCDQSGLTLPVLEFDHSTGCSIIGGYVYRGAAIPGLQGTYFYSDYCQGWVRSFRIEGGLPAGETEWPTLMPGGQVTSWGEDASGELYVVTQKGDVFKLVQQ